MAKGKELDFNKLKERKQKQGGSPDDTYNEKYKQREKQFEKVKKDGNLPTPINNRFMIINPVIPPSIQLQEEAMNQYYFEQLQKHEVLEVVASGKNCEEISKGDFVKIPMKMIMTGQPMYKGLFLIFDESQVIAKTDKKVRSDSAEEKKKKDK